MSDDEHITESELGTKDYWDDFYDNELNNFEDSGDCGETWFGKRNTHKIIEWIAEKIEKSESICDIGCGNGYILSRLASHGFTQLCGIDYSEKAIDFCKKMHTRQDNMKSIQFKVVDILKNDSVTAFDPCNVLVDKGTYDAIALMPDADLQLNRQLYLNFVLKHLKSNGQFVIMSCNFTKEELLKFLQHEDALHFVHEFETPKLSFGGKVGNQVTGLVMRKSQ